VSSGVWAGQATSAYAAYVGSGVAVEVPCWNQYLPCTTGSYADFSYADDYALDNLPCDFYHTPWAQALPEVSAEMPAKADRFPWCSLHEEQDSRRRFMAMKNLTSDVHGGGAVDMSVFCGDNVGVYPGGVVTPSLSLLPAIGNEGSLTPFTTYWDLTVTTTTRTCPTFAAAFGNAFAYAAQIEIVITIALVYVFKKQGVIRDAEGVVDFGAHGVVSAEKAAQLQSVTHQV